jgi:glycerol kinase
VLRVDGGMVASDWTMQCLADILDAPVDRPTVLETTAMGAAWLAGQHSGVLPDMEGFSELWKLNTRFTPKIDAGERESRYADWRRAVRSTIAFAKE